jgi:type IV pilus assembly protein PilA
MIVVAIIGVLAALALPSYRDYTTRAKVAEAGTVSSPARTALAEAFNVGALMGATDASLNLKIAATKYVASVVTVGTSDTAGTITVTMQGTGNSDIDGKTVIYNMECLSGSCVTTTAGSIPAKYLPKN